MGIKGTRLFISIIVFVLFISLTITGYADEANPPTPDPNGVRSRENPLAVSLPSTLPDELASVLSSPELITPRIVGGNEVSPQNAYPWLVSLQYYGTHYCGGSLIDPEWVLTAAHCWVDANGIPIPVTSEEKVVLGEHSLSILSGREQKIGISEVYIHPDFNVDTFEDDFALLKLSSPATINDYVKTIDLVGGSPGNLAGQSSDVVGWGTTVYGGSVSDVARVATINVLADSACSNYDPAFKPGSMLCAGTLDGSKDACQGDSGGPLAYDDGDSWRQVGVVSWGYGCGVAGFPGVYSRLSSVHAWVYDKIGLLKDTSAEIFIPNFWTGDGLEPIDGPECGTGNAASGVCSYKMVSNGNKKSIAQRYKYKGNAGDEINFGISRKASPISSTGRVIIKLVIIYTDGSTDRDVVVISKNTLNVWQQFSVQVIAAANFKAVSISVVDDLASGTIWVDKPSLKIVNTQELLDDPNLETFIPVDWDSGDNFDPVDGVNCNLGNVSSGKCSLVLIADGSKKTLSLRNKYRGNAGDTIDFSVFRKATTLSSTGRVIMKFVVIHLDGSTEREVVTISKGSLNVWQQFKGQIIATQDFKAISFSVVDDLNSGTMWLDDFFLDVTP